MNDSGPNPDDEPVLTWLLGVFASLALVVWGAQCIFTRFANVPGRHGSVPLSGIDAITFGMMLVLAALALHFNYFWGPHPSLYRYHEAGKAVSLLGFGVCLAYVTFAILRKFVE